MRGEVSQWVIVALLAITAYIVAAGGWPTIGEFILQFGVAFAGLLGVFLVVTGTKEWLWGEM